MDLPIPTIYGSISRTANSAIDICGSSSLNVQQLLLTAYAPKISVVSSASADSIAKEFGEVENVQHLLSYFESIFAYGSNYNSTINSITNSINPSANLAGSGCVRFVGDVFRMIGNNNSNYEELFNLKEFSEELKDYVRVIDTSIEKFSDPPNYTSFKENYNKISNLQNSIYLKLIALLFLSQNMSSFECFNHPVMQLVVISGKDSKSEISELTSSLNSSNLPKWLDKSSILQHIIILVDQNDTETLQNALKIQEDMKVRLGRRSTVIPLNVESSKVCEDPSAMRLLPSLFRETKFKSKNKESNVLILGKEAFDSWKRPLQEIISRDLLLFMNSKIKQWNDEVVTPRTSLTGRIFGGRKWGSSNKSSFFSFGSSQSASAGDKENNSTKISYDSTGGYYLAESPEMILRKLADWYFMLGDYKNAYTIYGLVKKNMINDKAYAHLSSLQEYSVFSLLLGASGKSGTGAQPITPKMISSVINPMLDSSFYSYLSRCNLKTCTLRLTIIAAELYFFLGQTTDYNTASNESALTSPNVETYYNESMILFKKVIDSKLFDNLSNSYLMQRIAYVYLSYNRTHIDGKLQGNIPEPSYYESENPSKLQVSNPNLENFGLSRSRRLVLWLLLSIKELNPDEQPIQSQLMVWRIDDQLHTDSSSKAAISWLQRDDGLLAKSKAKLHSQNSLDS
ncbi:hypothetical protein PMKS-000024 [Pichia membranifaciens]|uniref:Trafficking protein particle complex III-specific subunit 85 n=1 Tax=Pichia membranifaciens TaxID=4926 RepID=A0A1Q2YAL1_9ASCO|nr:hypothetical protein PMKS-000024 [Pichia membranifaciens]